MDKLLSTDIYNAIFSRIREEEVCELRLRVGKAPCFSTGGRYLAADEIVVTRDDIEYTLGMATGHSVYAVNDSMARGFIVCPGGYRLGICGEGVMKNGKLFTVKNITSLCLRVPHQIKNCCEKLSFILKNIGNTLIISPPGMGKTTMLRECARLLSADKNVLVLDERGELIPVIEGVVAVDTGLMCDVMSNIPKITAYETGVRTMRPDVIVTDEIFGADEVRAVRDVARCGIYVFASLHAKSVAEALKSDTYAPLGKTMRYFVELTDVGRVGAVYDRGEI